MQPTQEVRLSYQNTLTTYRGQSFFTSTFTTKNDQGHFVTCLDKHYERFVRSYHRLFERSQFPLTYDELKGYVDQLLEANYDSSGEPLHCIMMCVAGKADAYECETGIYSSGFGGDLEELVMMINPFKKKPLWCYNAGLNVLTMPYQRPFATAKPTNYLGGVQGQHILEALNIAALLFKQQGYSIKDALKKSITTYQGLNHHTQQLFRRFCHDVKQAQQPQEIQALQHYLAENSETQGLFKAISEPSLAVLQNDYHTYFDRLWHEVIFVSDDKNPFLLEGSTFSLMGIDANDTCVFVPLEGNTQKSDNLSDGYILESTTIALLQHVAKINNLAYRVASIRYEDITQLKALYCVSTTRVSFEKNAYQLQPCLSLDNHDLTVASSPAYERLMQSLETFLNTYSYEKKLETPYLSTSIFYEKNQPK